MSVYTIIITYVITINLIAFFLMGLDKWKARKRAWRIPEVTLFLFAIFGGSIGSIPPLVFFIWIATDLMCAASAHLSDLAFPC